ncbi:MAG: ATP-dependent DNA helicase RecG [Bacteroidetes bacterium]|nr:MAG: ATP-dependent DNA helicase RecG [Bacteroidota bacterium]
MQRKYKDILYQDIAYVKGIGPNKAKILNEELQIFTLFDLLNYFPFRYEDRSIIHSIRSINYTFDYVQIKGVIEKLKTDRFGEREVFIAYMNDGTGSIELIFYNGFKWLSKQLKIGRTYIAYGKVHQFRDSYSIQHPEIEEASDDMVQFKTGWCGVYNTTEKMKKKYINSETIRRWIFNIYQYYPQLSIPENLSKEIIEKNHLISREQAYKWIHLPQNQEQIHKARERLKFEELFFAQLDIVRQHKKMKSSPGFVFQNVGQLFNEFYYHHLPFQLTNAQKRVIKEIRNDTKTGKQMNRLLQGDVGSGKTIVAVFAALFAIDNGYQVAMMAPTEILAQQHYTNISRLLKNLPINVQLLTSSTSKKERKIIHEQLLSGNLHFLIGTHALIEDNVQFHKLGLAIIDEQHRFGVAQRAKIQTKGDTPPHVLVMTATPIPRTLAMTIYGDLDVSILDELPPNRKPVITAHRYYNKRLDVLKFVKEEIDKGRQAYFVFPLIQESEKIDLENLEKGFEELKNFFNDPKYTLVKVHGKMSTEEKDKAMQLFYEGKAQIMVATTVIEVGVDVPNASIMVIENANRFGLSQLHQLRGRVGRGSEKSYCILLTNNLGEDAKVRIETMVRTSNGFEISEVDLRLRGPGELAGTRQSGILNFKIADLITDHPILKAAREAAIELIEKDEHLQSPENWPIREYVLQNEKEKPLWIKIA